MRRSRSKSAPAEILRHVLPTLPDLQNGAIHVHVVGVGGTGSQVLTGLARLHTALLALGHPYGLVVTAFDPDRVSTSNVGRQLFSPADVGQSKAVVLINRLNAFFGLSWSASCSRYEAHTHGRGVGGSAHSHILITCVDTKAARREIHRLFDRHPGLAPVYWLDCGNEEKTGQVFLTQVRSADRKKPGEIRLPDLFEVLPEFADASIPEDNRPSCSLAEALESQNLVINQAIATYALLLLWNLFREGGLETFGYWVNLAGGPTLPHTLAAWYGSRPDLAGPRCRKGAANG